MLHKWQKKVYNIYLENRNKYVNKTIYFYSSFVFKNTQWYIQLLTVWILTTCYWKHRHVVTLSGLRFFLNVMLWHHCDHALVQFGHINLSVQVWKRKNMFWPKIPGLVATVAVYPSALLAADLQFYPQFYWAVLSQAAPAIDLLQSRTGPQCRLQLQPTSTRLPFKLILNSCWCWERDVSLVSLVLFVL